MDNSRCVLIQNLLERVDDSRKSSQLTSTCHVHGLVEQKHELAGSGVASREIGQPRLPHEVRPGHVVHREEVILPVAEEDAAQERVGVHLTVARKVDYRAALERLKDLGLLRLDQDRLCDGKQFSDGFDLGFCVREICSLRSRLHTHQTCFWRFSQGILHIESRESLSRKAKFLTLYNWAFCRETLEFVGGWTKEEPIETWVFSDLSWYAIELLEVFNSVFHSGRITVISTIGRVMTDVRNPGDDFWPATNDALPEHEIEPRPFSTVRPARSAATNAGLGAKLTQLFTADLFLEGSNLDGWRWPC
ncbi:hypothetical protein QQZ08_004393 [Neonectria magnoliae]|uniref:Uncharacterized protein n=1 Tax=Neonectria magnoliae TaxID=2732573 RepID=A0ABR1I6H4_9HYPO